MKFVYITGISRIAKTSVYSGLNNATDVSLDRSISGLFGATYEEIQSTYPEHLQLAKNRTGLDDEQLNKRLQDAYGGYSFKDTTVQVMNTLCVLQFLDARNEFKFKDHWSATGSSSLFLTIYKYSDVFKEDVVIAEDELMASTSDLENLTVFLFDVGLLTIKQETNSNLTLGFPNEYVKKYVTKNVYNWVFGAAIADNYTNMMDLLFADDINGFSESYRTKLVNIPFQQWSARDAAALYNKECVYQLMFNFYLQSTEYYRCAELCNFLGRSDSIAENPSQVLVIEFKVNGSVDEAIEQCKVKEYASHFMTSSKAVYVVGININVKKTQQTKKEASTLTVVVKKKLYKAAYKKVKK